MLYFLSQHQIILSSRWRERRKGSAAKNLLHVSKSTARSDDGSSSSLKNASYALHWKFGIHPLVLRLAPIGRPLKNRYLPSLSTNLHVKFVSGSNRGALYSPVIWVDDISITRQQYLELSNNESTPHPSIVLKIKSTNLLHFAAKMGIKQTFAQIQNFMSSDDIDEFRWWLSDDRVFRFFLTQLISYIHIFFEYMAFKDDWLFFSGRKNFSGISISSLLFAQLRSVIIFLYLADSDTSYLILFSLGKDILYNLWKLFKVLKVRLDFSQRGSKNNYFSFPTITYEQRTSTSASLDEQRTAAYDSYAIRHMSLCLAPAIVGVAVYSLIHLSYKSWYSWFLSSLADSVYFFGFISLTPQLYINYKLKSVAHLPIKAFAYKIFNTFIDDIFAFLVKVN
jgi:hypothetical protein